MSKGYEVKTHADGFGVWHAEVTLKRRKPNDPIYDPEKLARVAIRDEINARQGEQITLRSVKVADNGTDLLLSRYYYKEI